MESSKGYVNDLDLKATELRLGLPGSEESQERAPSSGRNNKRTLTNIHDCESKNNSDAQQAGQETAPPAKEQIVGWPPIRSYRKNSFQQKKSEADPSGIYIKVSMDGAPYLRKIDLKVYQGYTEFLKALESMFHFTIGAYLEGEGYKGSEYAPTYEDKDGDWMLAGDVPWDMFISSCKKLRIMKGSEVKGLVSGV